MCHTFSLLERKQYKPREVRLVLFSLLKFCSLSCIRTNQNPNSAVTILGLKAYFKTGKEIYLDANKPRLYALFRFIMTAYIVKCTATRYRRYKDRVEYIHIIHSP